MRELFQKFASALLRPYTSDIVYTIVLWGMTSVFLSANQFKLGNYSYCVYLLLLSYIAATSLSLIVNINKFLGLFLRPLILLILLFLAIFNFFCLQKFSTTLSIDILTIVGNTNMQETKEFSSQFISWYDILITVAVFIISFAAVSKIKVTLHSKIVVILLLILGISSLAIWHNPGIIMQEFSGEGKWDFKFDEIVDLRQHLTHPIVTETDSIHPTYIVILLGESFAKGHSSLYGYDKNTNPLLSQLMKNRDLQVFTSVVSPSTHTTSCFKYILNTHKLSDKAKKPWYQYTTAIEVFKKAGYKTYWISNQEEKGMFDNLPSGHSKICDVKLFNDSGAPKLDEFLINGLNVSKMTKRSCVFYHFMGQHGEFKERYPMSFEKFKSKDYPDRPKHQRQTIAEYDNSTLYNDFVVSSIIKKYQNKDAIVFYFPDHGVDIYVSDSNHASHAKGTAKSQKVSKQIPFMVYLSMALQKRDPLLKDEVDSLAKIPFCTDSFLELALQLTNYRIQ